MNIEKVQKVMNVNIVIRYKVYSEQHARAGLISY